MKAADTQEVKNLLLREHDQYRQLAERHHELDDRLHALTEKHFLSDSEQVEESTHKEEDRVRFSVRRREDRPGPTGMSSGAVRRESPRSRGKSSPSDLSAQVCVS